MMRIFFILTFVLLSFSDLIAQDMSSEGGFFKTAFMQQVSEGKPFSIECSSYGYFKSSSGWRDGKYYLLINDILPGTIVKIQLPSNQRSIYAKVLGPLIPAKENDGILLRLSAASMAATRS